MDERLAANRENWNDRTDVHLASEFYDVEGWLRDGREPRRHEREALGAVSGLSLLHLQCHFGLDTLTWARSGARHVTGIDFSDRAISAARDIARRAGLSERATFVCSDVYDATDALEHTTFDIVYVSLGALCWLPDVERWAAQVGSLVAPGGRFYIHDVHPLAWSLADETLALRYTYFEESEPFVEDSDETYTDAVRPLTSTRSYEWNHGIGEIVSALIGHGLRLEWLTEHEWTVWRRFPWLIDNGDGTWRAPPGLPRLPYTFSLLASRPA